MRAPPPIHPQEKCSSRGLLFVDEAGAAGLVYFQVDVDFDAVGDLDEGDAAVDTVVFAIEGHGAVDGALAGPLAFDRQVEGLGLGDSTHGKVADDVEGTPCAIGSTSARRFPFPCTPAATSC